MRNFMSRSNLAIALSAAMIGFNGCTANPDPQAIKARIRLGMTQEQVIATAGPPKRQWGSPALQCFEYDVGVNGRIPYAVYFNVEKQVALAERANCSSARARQLAHA